MKDKLRKLGAKLKKALSREKKKSPEMKKLEKDYADLRFSVEMLKMEVEEVLKKNPSLSDRGRYNN